MAFSPQSFTVSQVLTASQMNQIDTNIDEVRAHHKGNAAPASLAAGVFWIDDAATPWILKIYDGTDWIIAGTIDSTANTFQPVGKAGTWTPTIQDASGSDAEGQTYSFQSGIYKRIGDVAFITGVINISSLGTLSGPVRIAGLPFTSTANTYLAGSFKFQFSQNLTLAAAGYSLTADVEAGATHALLYTYDATGGPTATQITELSASAVLVFSGFYFI